MRYRRIAAIVLAVAGLFTALALSVSAANAAPQSFYHGSGAYAVPMSFYHG